MGFGTTSYGDGRLAGAASGRGDRDLAVSSFDIELHSFLLNGDGGTTEIWQQQQQQQQRVRELDEFPWSIGGKWNAIRS